MSGCSLCSGTIEKYHGSNHSHQHITFSQRLYLFADKNKGSISLCTIAVIVAIFIILRNRK